MSTQLVFCVETNKKAGTDWFYIKAALNQFVNIDDDIKLSVVYMGSKDKYASKNVLKEIREKKEEYFNGNTYIIYCIDTDNIYVDPKIEQKNSEIKEFCISNSFFYVWMCLNIEDVFWKKNIDNKKKVDAAREFRRNNMIEGISYSSLSSSRVGRHMSNLLEIVQTCVGCEKMRRYM